MLSLRVGQGRRAIVAMAVIVVPARAHAEEEPVSVETAPAVTSPAVTSPDGTTSDTPSEARPRRKKKKKRKGAAGGTATTRTTDDAESGVMVPWQVAATAGMLAGSGTLVENAATTGLSAEVVPTWQRGRLELRVPVKVEHRQTFGASLVASDARAGAAATYRSSPRLRIGGTFELRGVWKPSWPDQYQPNADGTLAETDRYSHVDVSVGAAVTTIPIRHWHGRLAWELGVINYADDPNFNMIDEPTHLVPGDHVENAVKADWRYFGDAWKAGVGLDIAYASYDVQYARDAGTGLTHAGPGGPPPNPFYREASVEPKLGVDLDLAGGDGELDLSYGYEIVSDRYQGYYSYRGHHPEAKLTWHVGELEAALKADLKWRTYGPDSYAPGGSHPPLEYGDRRVDHRFGSGLDVRYAVTGNWTLIGEADAIIRRTNFPNYVPNMFPASRQYDIEWSYENYVVLAGAEYHP